MSNPTPAFVPVSAEKTFSSYTQDQGANYAQNRTDYHPNLYKTIIDHHTSTSGQLNTLLDVGCGPGAAARALAPHFAHAIGLDPSEGMINNARFLAGASSSLNTRIGRVKGTPDLSLIWCSDRRQADTTVECSRGLAQGVG